MTTNRHLGLLWLFDDKAGFSVVPGDDDFRGYMRAMLICANGDGKLTSEERAWVVGHGAAYGAPDSLVDELKSYEADEDIEKVISISPGSDASRRFLVYDAIRACRADGEFSDPERATVTRMAAKLGVPEDVVKQIEQLCLEEALLRERRVKLMYPEGTPL